MGIDDKRRWIFFDLDDTLIPSSVIYKLCYKRLNLLEDKVFVQARANVKKQIQPDHTSSHNRLLYFKEFLTLNSQFSTKKLLQMNERYETLLSNYIVNFVNKSQRRMYIKKLSMKYNLAIVTNETCRTQMIKVRALDPNGKLFDCVLTSEEVGVAKPHSLIFERAIQKTSADPRLSIFVGDDYKNDIEPSLKIGMTAVLTEEFEKNEVDIKSSVKVVVIDHLSKLDTKLGCSY